MPRIAVAAIAAVGVTTLVAPPAHATFPGKAGKIAVSACGSVDCGVFLVDPAGAGATQLTHNPNRIQLPRGAGSYPAADGPSSWTPDGRAILYLRGRDASDPEPRVVDADGTNDRPFPAAPLFDPVFSPDGSRFAYVEFIPPGNPQIFVRNLDGSGTRQLTSGEGPGSGRYEPDWSPDGAKIAFTGPGPGTDIYVMSSDGSDQTRLLNSVTMSGRQPSWSPDGTRIAFVSTTQDGNYDIFTINSDGSGGPVNLSNNPGWSPGADPVKDETPAWSPDGTRIAFVRTVGNESRLMVMNPDGSGVQELATGEALASSLSSPVWQSIPEPRRADYRNASRFCKAERRFLGDEAFRQRYGGRPNAHARCVKANRPGGRPPRGRPPR